MHQKVLILDFGSQYTQLIARRIREANVYCEIHPHTKDVAWVRGFAPDALVLSGGPSSVTDEDAPDIDAAVLNLGLPTLGICYGQQLLVQHHGGQVESSAHREFGHAELSIESSDDPLFTGLSKHSRAWMSHGDRVIALPEGFVVCGTTANSPYAAIRQKGKLVYGLQFHPEVTHSEDGAQLLSNFLFKVAGLQGDWSMRSFIEEQTQRVLEQVGEEGRVICGLSGGVDSSVVAALLSRILKERLVCVFVDNGLLRADEVREVVDSFKGVLQSEIRVVDASDAFLGALAGVTDPEIKRKRIGHVFIDVFEAEANKVENAKFLAQGTLYPDVIESVSAKGPSATIKSHHNVGGLPEHMKLGLIEPLRELFKDEVRSLGRELGLPKKLWGRHPFPGPGLAIRVLGEVTPEQCALVRAADKIVRDEVESAGLYDDIWQVFAVLLPVRSVGVMGDARTYEQTACVRAVTSVDGMTADWSRIPYDVLAKISNRIINEVKGINRVVYDISSKPPGTIEWE